MFTKKIVILSLTFYKIVQIPSGFGAKDEKIFLQTAVGAHLIWKDLDLWDSAVFLSIKEEMLSQRNYKLDQTETDSETSFRQKNLVFGQLASYGHNMLIFSLDKYEVKTLLQKYCKIYGLTDQQVKDIMGTLEYATKQSENIQKILKVIRESLRQKIKTQEDENLKKSQGMDKDWEVLKPVSDDSTGIKENIHNNHNGNPNNSKLEETKLEEQKGPEILREYNKDDPLSKVGKKTEIQSSSKEVPRLEENMQKIEMVEPSEKNVKEKVNHDVETVNNPSHHGENNQQVLNSNNSESNESISTLSHQSDPLNPTN